MTTLEPYPFSWLTDADLADRLDVQARLDAEAGAVYQAMLAQAERAAQDSPRPEAASPLVRTPEATIDPRSPDAQLTALHESGHLAVGQLLGLEPLGASLTPGDEVQGTARIHGVSSCSPFRQALVLLGGPAAEAFARGGHTTGGAFAFVDWSADEVVEAARLVGADGLRAAVEHTVRLVAGSWERIESLARRLLQHGSLDSPACGRQAAREAGAVSDRRMTPIGGLTSLQLLPRRPSAPPPLFFRQPEPIYSEA